ncbi:MAG: hypothetical protein AAFY52_01380 [Pseudomonadota bacterium]
MGLSTPARVRTLRTGEWRLSVYAGEDWDALYDLRTDPHETHNLWDDPGAAGQMGRLALHLSHVMAQHMDESRRANRIA